MPLPPATIIDPGIPANCADLAKTHPKTLQISSVIPKLGSNAPAGNRQCSAAPADSAASSPHG
jgi:hypothetical protein